MGAATNRNVKEGIILQMHGLLQDVVFWVDYNAESVVEGSLAELGELCDRPNRVPSPLGVDFLYHLERGDGTKILKWLPDGKEVVAFEFDTRQEALAKLEDLWKAEIFECENGPSPHWSREEAEDELDEWLQEQYADDDEAGGEDCLAGTFAAPFPSESCEGRMRFRRSGAI